MINLKDAMFCWCSAERWPEWSALCEKDGSLPREAARVMVVMHLGHDAKDAAYLPSSWGACCDYWGKASNISRFSEMLLLFNRLVHQHGLSVDEVHSAFLNVEEYANKGNAIMRTALN
jgi:hypothetical protein